MTEEIRPICLYVETCLDRKEGTRDCAKCEHHLNYWIEVMIRNMEKNIKRLEQENKELKEENITTQKEYWKLEQGNDFLAEKVRLYCFALEEIKKMVTNPYPGEPKDVLNIINEVLE